MEKNEDQIIDTEKKDLSSTEEIAPPSNTPKINLKLIVGIAVAALAIVTIIVVAILSGTGESDGGGDHTHEYGQWSVLSNATCTENGSRERACACGYKETDSIDAIGHNYVEGVCENCNDINAEVTSDEYFNFTELNDGTYSIAAKDVTNMPKVVVIPSSHNGKPVTKIADYAFLGQPNEENPDGVYCITIEHMLIPDSVTSIGEGAFSMMLLLESLSLPNTVTKISDYAFEGLFSLKELTIPNSVTHIGYYAFLGCASIKSITIPESVTVFEENDFEYCFSLYEIINRSSVDIGFATTDTRQHGIVLHNGNGESKIVIQDDYVFYNMDGVNYLINYLGNDENLVLPNDYNGAEYEIIELFFFKSMKEFHEMASVLTNGRLNKMPGVPNYKSVTIPDFITVIDYSLFGRCGTLETVKIRETSSLRKIEDDAFEDCPLFKYYEDDNAYYLGNDDNPYIYLVGVKDDEITSFEFKEGTKIIGFEAFQGCQNLSNVSLPDSLTVIGDYAFCRCYSLTDISMSDSVIYIGDYAFDLCGNIESIFLSNNIYTIGKNAFPIGLTSNLQFNEHESIFYLGSETNPYLVLISAYGNEAAHIEMRNDTRLVYEGAFSQSRAESIIIGESVIGIGRGAFSFSSNLKTVFIPASVEYIEDIFVNLPLECITVDEGNLHYKSVNGDLYSKDGKKLIRYAPKKNETAFSIPNGITEIGVCAFSSAKNLKFVNIPDSVTHIGSSAFSGCSSIESISLPTGVTLVESGTFSGCESLKSITIPDHITKIGDSAFSGCESLTTFVIPDTVTYVGEGAFERCTSLSCITIPFVGVTPEGAAHSDFQRIFGYDVPDSLKTVIISEGIKTINSYDFESCYSITTIVLPNSITSIGNSAFGYCHSLTDVYYAGTKEEWEAIVIEEWGNSYLLNANIHYNYVYEE